MLEYTLIPFVCVCLIVGFFIFIDWNIICNSYKNNRIKYNCGRLKGFYLMICWYISIWIR